VEAIWVSAPRPITGPARPRYEARNRPASASARCSWEEISETVAIAPLNIRPEPAPTTTSPARKRPKLGEGSHTVIVNRPRPASSAGIAAASNWCVVREAVSVCARAAVANTANETAPATACER
jgi:hypothetical protein